MTRYRWIVFVALLIGGYVTINYVGRRQVDPTRHVSNLREYLAWQPSAEQFAVVNVNGKQHVIAYGEMTSGLVPASGPLACVFDDSGRLVDWSSDIGDDPSFDKRWNAQRSRDPSHSISRGQLERIAATQPLLWTGPRRV